MIRALVMLLALSGPALAVQPDEVLADPALEARARAISAELRCLVCRNESIDDSHAELARTLRLLVRERLSAGDSDRQVYDYLVARYGEFVLLRPSLTPANLALWLAGPAIFALGVGVIWRRFRAAPPPMDAAPPLSDDEKRRLGSLLDDPGATRPE